jgi:hypothetical protein
MTRASLRVEGDDQAPKFECENRFTNQKEILSMNLPKMVTTAALVALAIGSFEARREVPAGMSRVDEAAATNIIGGCASTMGPYADACCDQFVMVYDYYGEPGPPANPGPLQYCISVVQGCTYLQGKGCGG